MLAIKNAQGEATFASYYVIIRDEDSVRAIKTLRKCQFTDACLMIGDGPETVRVAMPCPGASIEAAKLMLDTMILCLRHDGAPNDNQWEAMLQRHPVWIQREVDRVSQLFEKRAEQDRRMMN